MFSDTDWEESNLQGFRFDLEEISTHKLDGLASLALHSADTYVSVFNDVDVSECGFCHKIIGGVILYESDSAFCSENCWKQALYTALDDFVLGGISAWPLDVFTSYRSKELLLQLASDTLSGEVILKVLLKFQAVLDKEVFIKMLVKNERAFNHFLNFLRQTGQLELASELFLRRGYVEEAQLQNLLQLLPQVMNISKMDAESVIHRLRAFSMSYSQNDTSSDVFRDAIAQLADLLQFQLDSDELWKQARSLLHSSDTSFRIDDDQDPNTLLGLPLAETVSASLLMANLIGCENPADGLRRNQKMCEEQFRWLSLESYGRTGKWQQLEPIILERKWLKRRAQLSLPYARLIIQLHKLKAPKDVISTYLLRKTDMDEFVNVAVRLELYDVALKEIIKNRDVSALKHLISNISKKRPEHVAASYYLTLPTNEWKEYNVKSG